MKELIQEFGGFILSAIVIFALITVLTLNGGVTGQIGDQITDQITNISNLGPNTTP